MERIIGEMFEMMDYEDGGRKVDYKTMNRYSDYNVAKAYLDIAWGAVYDAKGTLGDIDDEVFEKDLKDVLDELERIDAVLTRLALSLEGIQITLVAENATTEKRERSEDA